MSGESYESLDNRVYTLEAAVGRVEDLLHNLDTAVADNNRIVTGLQAGVSQVMRRVQDIEDDLRGVDEEMVKEVQKRLEIGGTSAPYKDRRTELVDVAVQETQGTSADQHRLGAPQSKPVLIGMYCPTCGRVSLSRKQPFRDSKLGGHLIVQCPNCGDPVGGGCGGDWNEVPDVVHQDPPPFQRVVNCEPEYARRIAKLEEWNKGVSTSLDNVYRRSQKLEEWHKALQKSLNDVHTRLHKLEAEVRVLPELKQELQNKVSAHLNQSDRGYDELHRRVSNLELELGRAVSNE